MSGGVLVLSLFPGIGLLDRAFEHEWPDACLVRGPDILWGGDIRSFHALAGVFTGIIGGPPCQTHSNMAAAVTQAGLTTREDLIPEFERVVAEAQPTWWLMENVEGAPHAAVSGYIVQETILNNRHVPHSPGALIGAEQHRVRRFSFGTRDGRTLNIEPALFESVAWRPAVCASGVAIHRTGRGAIKLSEMGFKTKEALAEAIRLQGLPPDFLADAPFTVKEKVRVVGNGVPLPMGRAIARAVRVVMRPTPLNSPSWVPCEDCDDFWCSLHQAHAYDCDCPEIEEWTVDPYTDGGPRLEISHAV